MMGSSSGCRTSSGTFALATRSRPLRVVPDLVGLDAVVRRRDDLHRAHHVLGLRRPAAGAHAGDQRSLEGAVDRVAGMAPRDRLGEPLPGELRDSRRRDREDAAVERGRSLLLITGVQHRTPAERDAERADAGPAELLHVAREGEDVEALLPSTRGRRRAGQLRHPEAAQIERGDVEAPLVERADRDLADVVEAAVGEETVDDDQRRPRRLLERNRRGDPLTVRALDDVVLELTRIAVADHGALPVLRDHEIGDVRKAAAQLREVRVVEVLGNRLQVAHQSVHRPLALRGDRQRSLTATLERPEKVAYAPAEQLAEEPERQQHDPEQDVDELGRTVQNTVLALGPCQPFPHGSLDHRVADRGAARARRRWSRSPAASPAP